MGGIRYGGLGGLEVGVSWGGVRGTEVFVSIFFSLSFCSDSSPALTSVICQGKAICLLIFCPLFGVTGLYFSRFHIFFPPLSV